MKFYLRITDIIGSVYYVERAAGISMDGLQFVSGYSFTKIKFYTSYFEHGDIVRMASHLAFHYPTSKIEIVGRVKAEGRKI